MVATNPSGVGNYIIALLVPMCEDHPEVKFFLYSNSLIAFPDFPNVRIKEGGAAIGPVWLNAQLPSTLKRDRIDVFWGANGIAPVVGALPPTVVTVHDMVYRFAGHTMGRGARWTKRAFQGWSVHRAAQVVAVSHATAHDVQRVYRRGADAVMPPIANAAFRRRDRRAVQSALTRYALPERFWLCTGTLEPRKNLVAFLSAYLLCLDEGLDLPQLALAGNPGWASQPLNDLIQRGESSGRIRRLGYVPLDDLACLYGGCELLWMPSIYEGFGMPLLEAQRCGAAVVHGSHASMVEAAGGLGLATGTDVGSLRDTIRRLVQGEASLACRLEQPDPDEAAHASQALWQHFCAAMQP